MVRRMGDIYELYNKFYEFKSNVIGVSEVIEDETSFKFKFHDSKYSVTYSKSVYEYSKKK